MTEVRVCEDWFPNGSGGKPGFWMNVLLKQNLDLLIKNVTKDWDFTIVISGQGEVRVGKSMMAQQIECYWANQMEKVHGIKVPWDLKNNFVFRGRDLIRQGNHLGQNFKYAPLVYDEAGGDLQGRKSMTKITQDLIDYFRECGQYNMLNILVLPEYFDLPKSIALNRSIFLIDVYYTGEFDRGYFNFFSKRQKKKLYLKGKKELDYYAAHCDFQGRFYNFYTVPEEEYRELKRLALKEREKDKQDNQTVQRNLMWAVLYRQFGVTEQDIADYITDVTKISMTRQAISIGIAQFPKELPFLSRKTQNITNKRYSYMEKGTPDLPEEEKVIENSIGKPNKSEGGELEG